MRTAGTRLNNERGVAMMMAMFFTVIMYSLSALFLASVVHENTMSRMDRDNAKAFYASHGAAQLGLNQLDILINTYLKNTIASANPSGVISSANSYVTSGDGVGWLAYSVRNSNVPVLVKNGEQDEYSQSGTVNGGTYSYTIIITEKNDPAMVGTDMWDFPYCYKIKAAGTAGAVTSTVVISGDFTVRVQKDNFAKFALFTNTQSTQAGAQVWFTDKTNFAGPVFTNDRFNFAFNPAGTFQDAVSQFQQTARFYNNGSAVLLNAAANGNKDVPVFKGTFTRGAGAISLNTATQEQDMAGEAKGGQSFVGNGIYLPTSGGHLSGGIYVKGDGTVDMSVDASKNAVYTLTQGPSTRVITVNKVAGQTQVYNPATGSSTTYPGVPSGTDGAGTLIYVDGNLTALKGTVQQDTQLTVGSKNDVVITNNVQYANFTPGTGNPGDANYVPPSADGANNLLGIVSWEGNVRIGAAAPGNVSVHGTIMAMNGVFQVDNYDQGASRGVATLLGGAITNNYGAFGTFNSATGQQVSGYGRNFVYDQRMAQGVVPPYFPSLNTFIAFTNDITDKMIWQEGG